VFPDRTDVHAAERLPIVLTRGDFTTVDDHHAIGGDDSLR
jgi:hypothetical protein